MNYGRGGPHSRRHTAGCRAVRAHRGARTSPVEQRESKSSRSHGASHAGYWRQATGYELRATGYGRESDMKERSNGAHTRLLRDYCAPRRLAAPQLLLQCHTLVTLRVLVCHSQTLTCSAHTSARASFCTSDSSGSLEPRSRRSTNSLHARNKPHAGGGTDARTLADSLLRASLTCASQPL